MEKEILSKYVCTNPFNYLDVQSDSQWVCCPSWANINIAAETHTPDPMSDQHHHDVASMQAWTSNAAVDIRKSVLDGTYKYCDHSVCPSLSLLLSTGRATSNFIPIEIFKEKYNIADEKDIISNPTLPETIVYGFDRSCNLKCPSCRPAVVPNDDVDSIAHIKKIRQLAAIENCYSDSAKKLLITGSGDPFYSKLYRDYLINFDETKYPNLEEIQIITNGILLTEKMWNSLRAKKYIKTIEISIDAASKHTYEHVTRLNGDWDRLLENINFLKTQPDIKLMIFSMVVSENNFIEVIKFYELITELMLGSPMEYVINYRQIVHWSSGAYSKLQIRQLSIFDQNHPRHVEFIPEIKKIHNLSRVSHNFHHLMENK